MESINQMPGKLMFKCQCRQLVNLNEGTLIDYKYFCNSCVRLYTALRDFLRPLKEINNGS